MSINTKVNDLAVRVGTEFKTVRTEIAAVSGDTYTKAEVDAAIVTSQQTAIDTAKNDLLNGAGAAYDTFIELQTEITNNDTDIAGALTAQATIRTDIGTNAAITSADYVGTFEAALL